MSNPLQAIIIDDSVTCRKIMTMVIEGIGAVELAGEFEDGKAGLIGIQQLEPDIIFLDIEMPEMNGLEVLEIVKRDFPNIGVIMVSGVDRRQADITIRALQLGAIDFIPKPAEKTLEENVDVLKKKIIPLIHVFSVKKNLNRVRQITGKGYNEDKNEAIVKKPVQKDDERLLPGRIDMVAIGISTGGPYALGRLIPKLPANFPVPILIVQHMPPNFTTSLANSLAKKSNIGVKEGQDGDVIEAGKVYIAPGGRHMVIKKDGTERGKIVLKLDDGPPQHGCRPSVDVLFKSIADNFDGNILSVIMTGMGCDGTEGVRAMKTKKCYSLIQDEASCVVYGMPKIVYENKLADEVISLDNLPLRITTLVNSKR